MAGTLPPGIGNPQQAMQATAFIRQQPWYLQWIAARGKTPDSNGNVRLSDDEQTQLRDLIVAKGIGLNNKFDGIDENGQIVEEHHKLRNGLIGAAIGGAALTGIGAAGIGPLSGLFGGASAAGAGTGAGVGIGESAATGIGGLSATSLGLPVSASLGTAGASAAGAAPLSTLLSGANSIADLGPVSPSAFGGASASVLPSFAGAVPDLGAVSPSSFSLGAGVPDLGAVSPLPGLQGPLAGDVGNVIGPGISGMGTGSSAAPAATNLPDWLKRAQSVGDSLSALSAGRAEGRLAEGQANQAQNRAAVDLYNTELNAPRTIARNAVKGDVLANAQDVHIDHPSTIPDFNITGGLRPSMFSDATRQTGRNITDAASRTPIPSPTAPILPDLPQAGGLDSFLNTASTISGLSRAVPPSAWGAIGRGLKGLFA